MKTKNSDKTAKKSTKSVLLSELRDKREEPRRIRSGLWDVNFGGLSSKIRGVQRSIGLVDTSVSLLAAVPGAGKTTLVCQILDAIAGVTKREVLMVAKEESSAEITSRCTRIGLKNLHRFRLVTDELADSIDLTELFKEYLPAAFVLDSLQSYNWDMREQVQVVRFLKTLAVNYHCPAILVGHVNKNDNYAGLQAMLNAVDTTMMLYNENETRILQTDKNRHGITGEATATFWSMTDRGLVPTTEKE